MSEREGQGYGAGSRSTGISVAGGAGDDADADADAMGTYIGTCGTVWCRQIAQIDAMTATMPMTNIRKRTMNGALSVCTVCKRAF